MFIDEAKIYMKSGSGGNGAVSFRREKYVQFGGPDGGDGGRGGHIIFVGNKNLNTLMDFRYNKYFVAKDGEAGKKKNMHGKNADDLYLQVPIGTMVRDFETNKLLIDIDEDGQERILLPGGMGGRGNAKMKTSNNKVPRLAEKGKLGKEMEVKLELKLLADVALVGYPNVGKSSFISKVTSAKPKIANYPFTTLKPKLGVVRVADEQSFVIADIPGLIEGAHEGVGLGDKFLRHIERCKLLFHIIDIADNERNEPIKDFEKINFELNNYSNKLSYKKQIVLANKIDLLEDNDKLEEFKAYLKKKNIELYSVSVVNGQGLQEVLYKAYELLEQIDRDILEEEESIEEILYDLEYIDEWVIEKGKQNRYIVDGRIVRGILNKYTFTDDEYSIRAFIQMLKRNGLDKNLREKGIKQGDIICIDEMEFTYVE